MNGKRLIQKAIGLVLCLILLIFDVGSMRAFAFDSESIPEVITTEEGSITEETVKTEENEETIKTEETDGEMLDDNYAAEYDNEIESSTYDGTEENVEDITDEQTGNEVVDEYTEDLVEGEEITKDEEYFPVNPIINDESLELYTDSGETTISRIEWWRMLIEAFHMSVSADNYPDNYYADLNGSEPYYREIMIATEFGLIDVEAGEVLDAEEPVSRETAAYSLNTCIGRVVEYENYTFSEAASVEHPQEIQVAIDEGWFELSDNNFLPNQPVTEAEYNALKILAEESYLSVQIDESHSNSYSLKSDVKFLGMLDAEITSEDELTIYGFNNLGVESGDKFALLYGDIPYGYRAENVETTGNNTVIRISHVEPEELFETLDIQTGVDIDLRGISFADDPDVTYSYIVGGTPENDYEDGVEYFNLEDVENKEVNALKATKVLGEYSLKAERKLNEDLKISLSITISDVQCQYSGDIFSNSSFFGIDGIIKTKLNISGKSEAEFEKVSLKDNVLGDLDIRIGGVGHFKIKPELEFSGKVGLNMKHYFSVIAKSKDFGFYVTHNFQKEEFSISCDIDFKIGMKMQLGIDIAIMEGWVYAEIGIKSTVSIKDHLPSDEVCFDVKGYLYANVGAEIKIKLVFWKFTAKAEYEIWNSKNSPARFGFHIENGSIVDKCTCLTEAERINWENDLGNKLINANVRTGGYYTPIDSKYAYCGLSTGTASSGEAYTIFEYSLDSDNKATITKYNGNVSVLNIPDEIDGYEVVRIGESVFEGNNRIAIVNFPDSLVGIGDYAFKNCTSLEEINLPEKLNALGFHVFRGCTSLYSASIPKALTDIDQNWGFVWGGPFTECVSLNHIEFEEGIVKIPDYLFYKCDGLKEISIPETVTSIGISSFSECTALKTVLMPPSLKMIGKEAFISCESIEEISIPDGVQSIGESAFSGCKKLKRIKLPSKLTELGVTAFRSDSSLETVEIPKGLNKIIGSINSYYSNGPFDGCAALKNVIFEEGITEIPNYLFEACNGLKEITIPNTVTKINKKAFKDCVNLEKVIFSSALSDIREYAFQGCSKLEKLEFPASLSKLGSGAFFDCVGIKELKIPKSLTKVDQEYAGYYASSLGGPLNNIGPFNGCSSLKKVTFEEGTKKIPDYILAGCKDVTEIMIPESVTEIGIQAFYFCEKVECFNLGQNINSIDENAFGKCTSIEEIDLPQNLMTIGNYAFADCTALKSIVLPESVSSIGDYAFAVCTSLETATVPQKRKNIVVGMFMNCEKLRSINLPDGLEAIRERAFQNCSSLEEIIIPGKVTVIEQYAFQNCDALVSVKLSNSVTSLGSYCFDDCAVLKNVDLGKNLTSIPQNALSNCPELEEITVPYYCKSIGKNAFQNDVKLNKIIVPRNTTSIDGTSISYPVTVYGVPGTYAETFCEGNSMATFSANSVAVESVAFEEPEIVVTAGQSVSVNYNITPMGCTDVITWKIADTSIATVNNGVVKGINAGTTKLTLTLTDDEGKGKKASCNIRVVQPVTSISLNKTYVSIEGGDTINLIATANPTSADNREIVWSTSDGSIATVDQTGKVTAIGKGNCKITATAADGNGVSKSCTVEVTSNLHIVSSHEGLRSDHPYSINMCDIWTYKDDTASTMKILFSAETCLEEDSDDYIEIRNANKNLVGKYTENQLSGKTITVSGNQVYIKLVSDGFNSGDYGFSVDDIITNSLSVTIGDLNGDGTINRADKIYLARYLSRWPGYELQNAELVADINGDGNVNRADKIYLARYLAKWPGYTLD